MTRSPNYEAGSDIPLMKALNFTADDLKANQDGLLTDAQRDGLHRKRGDLIRAFLLIYWWVPPTLIYLVVQAQNEIDLVSSAVAALFVLAILALGMPLIVKWRRLTDDIRNGVVQSIEGPIALDIRSMFRGGARLTLTVNEVKFGIAWDALLAFRNNKRYAVYYVPLSRVLVSARAIPGAWQSP